MEKKPTGGVSTLEHAHTIHKGSAAPLSETLGFLLKLPVRYWKLKLRLGHTAFGWLRSLFPNCEICFWPIDSEIQIFCILLSAYF